MAGLAAGLGVGAGLFALGVTLVSNRFAGTFEALERGPEAD